MVRGVSNKNSSPEQRKAFGAAVSGALTDAGLRVSALFPVAGSKEPESARRAANDWLSGSREPSRPQVIAIEELVGVEPGGLSRHLGWLPVGAPAIADTELAILADPGLKPIEAKAVIAVLRSFKVQ
jgi:hypothetical protein